MKFYIVTFGCKVNNYESNMMKEQMLSSNFLLADSIEEADIVIVNTCTVTNTADNKCLKMVRHIIREYPDKILVVAGCSSQNKEEVYKEMDIDILLGNKDKSKVAELIKDYIKSKKKIVNFYLERNLEFEDMQVEDYNHVRAFVKIEDGCDNFCSYCIIPFVRGSVRCKEFNKVIEEVNSLVNHGHKEVVLTGIHTGRYNSNGYDLVDLINEMSKISGLKRIRISSIEITEINDKFIDMMKNNHKVCNHLHIPLQAGSNLVLQKMNRKYDLDTYEKIIKDIRKVRPDISISTDVIVGFPYETDELFLDSMSFCEKIKFSKIHVFPYSMRKGTAASVMPQIDGSIKKERGRKLMELSRMLEQEYYDSFKGKMVDVLVEECDNNKSVGHTSNYLKVEIPENLVVGNIYKRVL